MMMMILFVQVYGGQLNANSGEIASPLYPANYPDNVDYNWIVTVDLNKLIRVTFQTFHIEPSQNCIFDYVKVGS